jgi:hypothetical protein
LGINSLKQLEKEMNYDIRVEKRSFQAQKEGNVHNLFAYEK